MADKKTCFIIGPIGDPETDVRKWADFVREHIVTPAVTNCGYTAPARSDDPDIGLGLIMESIIEKMFSATLVVADLTDYNPNVFYELGIRHCAPKPAAIHLIKVGEKVPFDLGDNKAIFIDRDYEKVISARLEIEKRIKAIEKEPKQFYSQVQRYIQHKQLELFKDSQTGKDRILIETLTTLSHSIGLQSGMMRELHDELVEKPKSRPPRFQRGVLTQAARAMYNESYKNELRKLLKEKRDKLKAPNLSDIATEKQSEKDEQKQ